MKKLLITGATGFIGRRCVALASGREVHAITSRPARGSTGSARWHQCDLHDADAVESLIEHIRPDELLHLAWYTDPPHYWTSDENQRWVASTLHLARAFVRHGQRLVATGTSAEYDWRFGVLAEESTPLDLTTPYGSSKNAARTQLAALTRESGTRFAWARIFAAYGPREHESKLISKATAIFRKGGALQVPQKPVARDYIFVDDVARALLLLVDNDATGPVNIGTGVAVTVQEIAERVAAELGAPCRLETAIEDRGEAPLVVAETSRIRSLGWEPQVDLIEGIRATIASVR